MRAAATALSLALRFLLELCALAALGYGGYGLGGPLPLRIALAAVLPSAAALLWGRYAAPRAPVRRSPAAWLATQLAVMGAAVAALAATGHPLLAGVFAAVLVANTAALAALGAWHPPRPGAPG
ncbi:DUF2568 domain-containing protein [Peterkaempfera bronchialis]|uniref:DUF2568 domain-containing protein n=1 Tax=Peterkaempfera bronchialis TaxID=2126346 RepID=UPI003C2E3D35